MINIEQDKPPVSAAPADSFQSRVQPWMMACFGAEISADTAERNHRLLEETLELVQACGCAASEAHQLVDYVYGRPVGERAQEVGGVMVTLATLCLAQGLDMHAAGETELARIWTKVEVIRAKQAAKPKHSPLPAAAPQPIIGRLMDQISALPVLWGLNEPGALLRNSDVFRVLVAAGREQAGIAAAPAPWPATKDTCTEMRALCSACGGNGDMHGLDGEWRGQCTCVHAWQQRAEKAEARLKELGAQLTRRHAPLSPETQQAITAARAAGQTIAATPASLVFMNDGAEPGSGELDCPVCGGSGHAGDVAAGSAP
ncbi:hypothetical protein [Janthinobacterium lividum]|uniref:Uncharacterized protein n=1 Tax=Janthinobacterium lividum TaxID=29581 RepID=A0ABU0XPG9_9BURK|nr:hypothetical protein [Janthinobacterium lividum]MDQ4625063.1 hypothetical protein [Janthinobacterium lividum]MDQ4673334.1 hypothetical protein [Janthinobacterium lividum]MDQ4684064.1 hypothetical protein [Janthinobacterium lividum]